MATDNDMEHLIGAVRTLLRSCDVEPLDWFERLDASWPSSLTDAGNTQLSQLFALTEFDPLAALTDRAGPRKTTEAASRYQQDSGSRNGTSTLYSSHKPVATNAAPAPSITPREHHRTSGQSALQGYSRTNRKHENPATQLPWLNSSDTVKSHNSEAAIPPQQTTSPVLPSDNTTPQPEEHPISNGRTGIPSSAHQPTALATRRKSLARQRKTQRGQPPSSLFILPKEGPENTGRASATATTTRDAGQLTLGASQQLANKRHAAITVDDTQSDADIEVARKQTPSNPPSKQPSKQPSKKHQRVHDVTPENDPPASSMPYDSGQGVTESSEILSGQAANSDDVAAQLTDAAYRRGIDLS